MDLEQFCSNDLEARRQNNNYRSLTNFSHNHDTSLQKDKSDQPLLNFSSNDYLGLRNHHRLQKRAQEFLSTWGAGTGASRLVAGNSAAFTQLEKTISQFKHTQSTLVFSSGYAANVGTLQALMQKGDLILCDKWNHASIIDGCRLAETSFRTFPHLNYKTLRETLQEKRQHYRNVLLVSDSVFSMDGDTANLQELVALKKEFDCWLMIDEAHATGVLGEEGRGLAHASQLTNEIDIHMGTLSKAIGSMGGFVAGKTALIEYLINHARSFIYSTGLAPAACGAAQEAFEILQSSDSPLQQLQKNCELWESLTQMKSPTPIYPLIIGDSAETLKISQTLAEKGFFIQAIRPPTVPPHTARLRITITATHTSDQIKNLAKEVTQIQKLLN